MQEGRFYWGYPPELSLWQGSAARVEVNERLSAMTLQIVDKVFVPRHERQHFATLDFRQRPPAFIVRAITQDHRVMC